MFVVLITYAIVSLAVLVALASMILKIGSLLGECPQTKAMAKSAAVTIATGFCAIGLGGVMLVGSTLPVLQEDAVFALVAALGVSVLCLGLGFTQAIVQLRAVLRGDEAPEQDAEQVPG